MDHLLSAPQVAQHLNLSLWTVYRWARLGKIPSLHLGTRRLFLVKDLQIFIRLAQKKQNQRKSSLGSSRKIQNA